MVSGPAMEEVFGKGLMVTFRTVGGPGHPKVFVSTTVIVPPPALPQLTVMVSFPCPLAITPPVTVQLNVAPGPPEVVYIVPIAPSQTLIGPLIGGAGGIGLTVTVMVSLSLHTPVVPVTINVVVTAGETF